MSQNGKLMPNLDQQSTKMLNLTVLQRIDPFVEEILFTAAHVTFYDFNLDQNQWSRKDVEGSLFVVKRSSPPRFQFIVMNRRNTDNLVENLLGDFEYEVQVPYLLYRNAAQEVSGIWFYNQHECEEVANLFERILNAYSKVPSNPKLHTTNSEFEELEAVPTSAMIEGPLEPSSSSLSTVTDIPDDAFVNFFSSAINMGSNPAGIPLRSNHSTLPMPSSSHNTSAPITTPAALPVASPVLPHASAPVMSIFESADSGISNHAANLLKPMFFAPSPLIVPPLASSTTQATPPVNLSVTLQRPYGTPLLQPFPPPTPSPALTPAPSSIITRDKVRDALVRLAQNDQFIDMVYREILNAHSQ